MLRLSLETCDSGRQQQIYKWFDPESRGHCILGYHYLPLKFGDEAKALVGSTGMLMVRAFQVSDGAVANYP